MSQGHVLFAGSANPALGQELAALTGSLLGDATLTKWSDGETRVELGTPIARKEIVIVQPVTSNDALIELLWMLDAAKRHGAASVVVVAPFCGYSRQDKPTAGRQEPCAGALTLRLIEFAGASRLITVDVHNQALASAVSVPLTNMLPTAPMPAAWTAAGLELDRLLIAAPDPGAIRRAGAFSDALGKGDPIVLAKRRTCDGRCSTWGMVGDVRGRPVMLIDDVTSTGTTLVQAAQVLLENGAEAVYATVSHLRGPANVPWLDGAPIARLFVTDSTPIPTRINEKLTVVGIAPQLAQVIGDHSASR